VVWEDGGGDPASYPIFGGGCMDASVFCFVAGELNQRIRGMRVEKVFAPLPETWTFSLGRAGHLVLCTGKPTPFLYLAEHKPENPQNPSGSAMWLRKRLKGRRILDLVSDWPLRRLALDLSPGDGRWLILHLEAAPLLADTLPPGFGDEPQWPELERIMNEDGLWRTLPHLTPPASSSALGFPGRGAGRCGQSADRDDLHLLSWP
jgi:hypothetical protein